MNAAASCAPARCKLCQNADVGLAYRLNSLDGDFDLLECGACGFRFIDHLDDPGDEIGTVDLAAVAADAASGLESNCARIASNAALLNSNVARGALLDVGCGGGAFLLAVKERFVRAVGIELDPRYVALSRARGLNVVAEPLESAAWDAESGRFDAITMWDVIEHVNDPASTVARALGLLKPGGMLFLDTPSRDGFLYRFGELTARLTRGRHPTTMGLQYSRAPFCHKQIFRRTDMRRMLARAGFGRVTIFERFELSFSTDFYLQSFVRSAWLAKCLSPVAAVGLWLLPISNKLIVTAMKLPGSGQRRA